MKVMNPVQLDKVLYTARATAEGGRDGRSATDDGKLDVIVAPPKELGGSGNGTNPEQLFAAGFAACFHNAFRIVARKARQDVDGSTVTAEVAFGPVGGGPGYGLAVNLIVDVPGVDRAVAEQLVSTADKVCPYSNATRGNIAISHTIA
jgi:osmotically inducible protein OsmC